jgi:putative phage-type endonuclease
MSAMIQGSAEWLAYRINKFNASEAGAIMGVNPWFPKNPAELFDLKTGAAKVEENAAMARGTAMEDQAREWLQVFTNTTFTPVVRERGRYSASLDGLDFDEAIAAEIKCPYRRDSKLFGISSPADLRAVAPHYWFQIVHQFYVAGFRQLYFLAYHPDYQNIVPITRDDVAGDFDALVSAWEAFGECLDAGTRPESETLIDESAEFAALVDTFKTLKAAADTAQAALKTADDALKAYAQATGKTAVKGCGVTVQRSERKGAVKYEKIPELQGVDLERYRAKPTVYWSIK